MLSSSISTLFHKPFIVVSKVLNIIVLNDSLQSLSAFISRDRYRGISLTIIFIEIFNSFHDSTRCPCTISNMRVFVSEPGWKCSRVWASNSYHLPATSLVLLGQICLDLIDHISNVSQSILNSEILQILSIPVCKWLRLSIVPMLKHIKDPVVLLRNLLRKRSLHFIWRLTSIFSADEEENVCVLLVLISHPILPNTEWKGSVVLHIKMIKRDLDPVLSKLSTCNPKE